MSYKEIGETIEIIGTALKKIETEKDDTRRASKALHALGMLDMARRRLMNRIDDESIGAFIHVNSRSEG